jgi:hypothetical protein
MMARSSRPAVIYVAIRADDAIKIGFTRNLSQRIKALARQFPGAEIIDELPVSGESVRATEMHAHGLVWGHRSDGEWFWISPLEAKCALVGAVKAVAAGLPIPQEVWRCRYIGATSAK